MGLDLEERGHIAFNGNKCRGVGRGSGGVLFRLHFQQVGCFNPEGLFHFARQFRREGCVAIQHIGERGAPDAKGLSGGGHAHLGGDHFPPDVFAYANHIGEYWAKESEKEGNKLTLDDKFSRQSTMDKLRSLYRHYGLPFDVSNKPFTTAKILFEARSEFTHPRTKKIEAKLSIDEELDGGGISGTFDLPFPTPRTFNEAKEALEDCMEIIRRLHDFTGEKEISPAYEDPFSTCTKVELFNEKTGKGFSMLIGNETANPVDKGNQ